MNDDELEEINTAIPGPRTLALVPALREFESRNITYVSPRFPVFWESASGATVTDVDGNRYIDMTAAFGVASVGHANPYVVSAVTDQAARLMHGMGDVHPTSVRVRLLEALPAVLPEGLSTTFLATTGSEAVEAALKTAALFTGKPHFAAYRNGYHGLSFGALQVGGVEKFRAPFARSLGGDTLMLDFPEAISGTNAEPALARARAELGARDDIAGLIVEPIQGRGGCVVPPAGYLAGLRAICDELGIVLIFDEIFTGFGRTGAWFAADHENVVPDLICIGKAMGAGFPISALCGRANLMAAWPESSGEALHTSTYLGNPMGCAAALATIHELGRLDLPKRARNLGMTLARRLDGVRSKRVLGVRGRGLLWGVRLRDAATATAVVERTLASGAIFVQCGPEGDVISISPPLVISERQMLRAVAILEAAIAAVE